MAFLRYINCLGMAGRGATHDLHGQDFVVCRGFGWVSVLPRCESVWALRKPCSADLYQPWLLLYCGVGPGVILFSKESSYKLDREQLPHSPVFCVGLLCTP